MINASIKLFLRNIVSITVCTIAVMVLVLASNAHAAGGNAKCTIITTPTPPIINAGQSVSFSGNVSGKAPQTYAWTFAGGDPSTSTDKNVSVSYAVAGSFPATLNGTNAKGQTCFENVTVTVNRRR